MTALGGAPAAANWVTTTEGPERTRAVVGPT